MSDADEPVAASAGVTVVIVTYESASVVADCLRSLPAALDGVGPYQVVVVDNASTDDTVTVVRAVDPGATVVALGRNEGYGAGINRGVAAARPGGAVLALNPDIRLEPGAVAALHAALDGGAGVAVPRLVDGQGRRLWSLRREPTVGRALVEGLVGGGLAARLGTWGETVVGDGAYRTGRETDWATGAAMLISRACREDLGAFDESFFLYSEETDFMLRARDAGHPVRYVDEAVARHEGGELLVSPRLWELRTVNRVRLHRRRHGRASTVAFVAASMAGEAVRALAGRPTSRRAVAVLARQAPGIVARPPDPPAPAPPGWICFCAQDWWYHNRAHSDFQLMRRVARRRDVLLVNTIGLRVPLPGRSTEPWRRITRKLRSVARPTTRPVPGTPGFHVMTPLSLPTYGSERARRFNAWLVSWQVSAAARKVGVVHPARPAPVHFLTIPTAVDASARLPRSVLAVNRSDKQSAFPEADTAVIEAFEAQALRAADRVFFTSHALLDEERPLAGDRARFLDHGVDARHFRRRPLDEVPADLRSVPGPIVGFFGSLDDYLVDFALLEAVATALPDASLVLIGDPTCPLDALEALPNVHLLGYRPYETIPAYGSRFDVALMPWLRNRWISHSNPIKMKEYLALGLPVVSIEFREVDRYRHLIRVAADEEGFVAGVKQTLVDGGLGTPAERRAAVEQATWDDVARGLLAETEGAASARRSATDGR